VLSAIGAEVADNSAKAARRDWAYSMEGHPPWCISGERMGLGHGREAIAHADGELARPQGPDRF
jgi:hypothetical protein